MNSVPEAWLAGPIEGVTPYLVPVAHSLVQAGRDVERVADLTPDELWARPGGAASVGFHLRHVAGVLDRLLSYARAEELSEQQMRALRSEAEPGQPPADAAVLVRDARYHAAEHATRHSGQAVTTATIVRGGATPA